MSEMFPTRAGQVTRGECFSKLLHHLDEAANMCAVISHLHNTEDSNKDKLHAKGWLGIVELIKRMRHQIVQLARFQ